MGKVKAAAAKVKAPIEAITKVKNAGVTKPSQTPNAKSKQMAKGIATKEANGKKSKKSKVESSESESEDSESSEDDSEDDSSESESEEEVKPAKKATTNGAKANGVKTNGAKPTADSDSDSESDSEAESDSEDSESDEEEEAKPKANGAVSKPADDDSDSSDSSDSDSEEEAPKAKAAPAAAAKPKAKAKAESSEEDDDSSEDDSEDSSEDDSEDEESEEKEEKPAAKAEEPAKKRKALDDPVVPTKKSKTEDSGESSTLFAGSLAWAVNDQILYEAFQEFPGLTNARVVTDRESGRSRGFGYVDFGTHEEAKAALEASQGKDLEGRPMNLDFAGARPNGEAATPRARAMDRAKQHGDVTSPPSDTLFVGNLPFGVDQDTVYAFFSEVAEPSSVRLPTDPESGNPKGFGYVSFSSVDDAQKALNDLNGSSIGEGGSARAVRLDFASARPPREGGFGGGRGGGGRGGRGGQRGGGRGGARGGPRGGGRGGGRGGFGASPSRGNYSGSRITF